MNGIGQLALGAGIMVGVGVGTAALFHFHDRKSPDQLTDRMFTSYDHDNNGAIEFGARDQTLVTDERFQWNDGPATSTVLHAEYGGSVFAQLDGNSDGTLTRNEAIEGFALLDTNGDGAVGGLFSHENKPEYLRVAPKFVDYHPADTSVGVVDY